MVNEYIGVIREIEDLTDVVRLFTIDFEGELNFKAGQFVNLGFEDNGERFVRPYSVASSPAYKNSIQLVIRLVQSGKVTPHLWNKKQGDYVDFKGAFGMFNLDAKLQKDKIVFIGTGTGIAPFRSMIQDLLYTKKVEKELILIFGVKYKKDILFKEEFEKLEREFANFKFVPVVSRDSEFEGRRGHVQNNFDFIDPFNSEVYLCGLPLMVDGAKAKLIEIGMDAKSIYLEKY